MDTNIYVVEETELRSMQCFREITPNHAKGGTELHICLLLHDTIINKIIPDIYMHCPLAAQLPTIILYFDGAMAVLVYNIIVDLRPLIF